MPKLYGTYRSRATRNVWLAAEADIELHMIPVWQGYRLADPLADDAPLNTRSAAFRQFNPAGTVPVLDDAGLILTESLAINLYLARTYGGALGPETSVEDAQMQQWALFAATGLEDPGLALQTLYNEGRATTAKGKTEASALRGKLALPLSALEAHLSKHKYMVGQRFTVADINTAEVLRYATSDPQVLADKPATRDWLAACQDRAGFKTMWALREAEPINYTP